MGPLIANTSVAAANAITITVNGITALANLFQHISTAGKAKVNLTHSVP
jgi:hypothetical protein